jgi:hypothetical protein
MRSIPRLLMTVAFVLVLTSSVVHAVYPSATWAGMVVGDGYLVYFWGGP